MKRPFVSAVLLSSLLGLTACAWADAPKIAGRSLMWAEAISKDCEVPPEIEFTSDGRVSGNTACNQLTGTFSETGTQLDLSKVGATKRACGPKLMEVENRFLTNLHNTRTFQIENDTVKLIDANGKVVMTLVPMMPGSCN